MASDRAFLEAAYKQLREVLSSRDDATLPSPSALQAASAALPQTSDPDYLTRRGPDAALTHILDTVVPALNGQNLSGRYYGFVTGSALPVAEAADNVVSAFDQNVQVHLPAQTASTAVEDAALRMLVDVLGLGPHDAWPGRTFTTGATASNVLGLACGRESVVASRLRKLGREGNASVGEAGLLAACQAAGVREIQVLTSMGHSSLSKAASVVGLGRASVKEVGVSKDEPWRLDLGAIEKLLQREGVASIIAVSAGEVNTGRFATKGEVEMRRLRTLADKYGAWVHVDGGMLVPHADFWYTMIDSCVAFGIFARALPRSREFSRLHELTAGLELADSITVDGHKLLNVVCSLTRPERKTRTGLSNLELTVPLALRRRSILLPRCLRTDKRLHKPQRRIPLLGRRIPDFQPLEHRPGELSPLPRIAGVRHSCQRGPRWDRRDARPHGDNGAQDSRVHYTLRCLRAATGRDSQPGGGAHSRPIQGQR